MHKFNTRIGSSHKTQGCIIQAQSLKIKELEHDAVMMTDCAFSTSVMKKNSVKKNVVSDEEYYSTDNAFIYQNTPNPFDRSTEIKYFLPDDTDDSYIYIFNMHGTMLLSFKLTGHIINKDIFILSYKPHITSASLVHP